MNEQEKLNEARYFLSCMRITTENSKVFSYNLSAFLTSGRSVLQYTKKEACAKSDGKKWYDDRMKSSRVLSFFKTKRDFSIHKGPVAPEQVTYVHLTETVHVSDPVTIRKYEPNGKLIETRATEPAPAKPIQPESKATYRVMYWFPDWSGSHWKAGEDVITLCENYLRELGLAVNEGKSLGFLNS